MSGTKAALKAINDAIKQNKFDDAVEKAEKLIDKEPRSYQGHIFWAFALDQKNSVDEAEAVYLTATSIRPEDPQAWQGLIKLYEKQGVRKLQGYQNAVIHIAKIYHDAEDMYKCQVAVDKYVDFARVHGDQIVYADALWIRLPESPIYSILEGRFPHPSQTYLKIAHIVEDTEKKRINTLVGERRTRLGAKLSEVTLEVKREVYEQSRLEDLFRQVINWTNDDELRRKYEEKLLQYCHDRLLAATPGPGKQKEYGKVVGLANDMIIIDHPYKLAWDVALDWKDPKEVKEIDVNIMRSYCNHFPESDSYKVFTAYLTSSLSPFPPAVAKEPSRRASMANGSDDSSDDDDGGGVPTFMVPLTEEERLMMMTEGISTCQSVLALRLAGEYFLHLSEYESTVELTRKAGKYLQAERSKSGQTFLNTQDSYDLTLAMALVYYQSPRHHREAKNLFDGVLEHDSTSTPALIGVGLIYEEEEEYDQAVDFLSRALQRDGTNLRVKSEAAWVKALKGEWITARDELMECIEPLEAKKDDKGFKELLGETQYRIGRCIWEADSSRQARKQKKGDTPYRFWLSALSNHLDHAPSYTALGIYYADYAKDKQRARRCLQKALELSSSEVEAAIRLARSFANDGDWDRVELVAQRIVNSGKVRPPPGSKREGISWPFAALGVAQLNKQNYHQAIVSFQSALRITPTDYHSWVGLGESYHNSGRYVAATKAIMHAQALEANAASEISGDLWFTKYILANVKRELGEYDEAISLYRTVLETHAEEEGVVIALLQTMVENALTSIENGLFGKAVQLASEALEFAMKADGVICETFNFWKGVADASSIFIYVKSRCHDFPVDTVKSILKKASSEALTTIVDMDGVSLDDFLAQGVGAEHSLEDAIRQCTNAIILCEKQAISVSVNDIHAQAVAYYNLGWAEYRAHVCTSASHQAKSSKFNKAAVRCFKRAIELEAGNPDFWNALGVVTSGINPSISQHAFVRSLHLNERSPVAWTNLGVLALVSGDMKMANEAFTRAQSNDPDYAHAWLGQGFVALLYGDEKEARGLFTHAMEIADSASTPIREHFASSMFDHILTSPNVDIAILIQPILALSQVQGLEPQNLVFGHLAALFLERTRDGSRVIGLLEKICGIVEAEYEQTESSQSLARFTLAKTDLARAYLAAGEYEKAVESGELALGLSSDDNSSELTLEERKKARLSSHLAVGLAQYYAKDYDAALECFEAALEESDQNADASCLLAQVLWAQGSESTRDRARGILFDVIERQPDHVQSVLLLGVIGLLDDDQDSLEAVVEELQRLRTNSSVTAGEQAHIGEVLRAVATRSSGEMLTQVQNDVMLYPCLPHGWSGLASTTGDGFSAQMALKVATKGIPPHGNLDAQQLALAYGGTGLAADAQRAAFLAPWEPSGWKGVQAAAQTI